MQAADTRVHSERGQPAVCARDTHLKLGPVHAHAWSVGVSPPSQVFGVVGCLDCVAQVPVQILEPIGQDSCQSLYHANAAMTTIFPLGFAN